MRTLIVPGLGDSGPTHWQSLWENANPSYRRVRQRQWDKPQLDAWALRIKGEIQADDGAALLIAHSFGCLATARVAHRLGRRIAGALLVAPADPAKFGLTNHLPNQRFDFPAILVGSRSDPWLSLAGAQALADTWGCQFVDAGDAGHINADAGYGPWPDGERLLAQLVERIAAAKG